eukprot:TRINITY_DN0_c4691_g1_i1.p1 TRINITY_DN0_c4691_g1~~TRINITY_DN0_c4691_g1_i1.p1  ORF type:complete len:100 (-),score=20.93 TRINITY_DN0_c4691_g1_i1:40-339(-)
MDRETIEEDVFNYTKQLKSHAQELHETLHKDTRTINNIENSQNKNIMKTKKESSRLSAFMNLSSGTFCSKLCMLLLSILIYIMTIFIIQMIPYSVSAGK